MFSVLPSPSFKILLLHSRLKLYISAIEISNILDLFHGENLPKLGLDTSSDLCYISNKSLLGLFCKNVHISVNRVAYNKVAFFICPADACHVTHLLKSEQ